MEGSYEIDADLMQEASLWRRHLHENPELAFQETETSRFIASRLAEFGLVVDRGIGGTGVVGTLRRGTSDRAIAIRADMDALPIIEETGVSYSSRNHGIMHACGHDGHVAMALAAARACSRLENLDGIVHFIFQPAEENEGGAARMVDDGLFKQFPCEAIFATHNWPSLPLGTCVARSGAIMAAFATFELKIAGRGGHAAMPHLTVDPIVAASHMVSALQTVASRNVDPQRAAVLSVTQIHGGSAWNLIPSECTIRGSVRWFDDRVGERLEGRIRAIAGAIARSFECEVDVTYQARYPATVNAHAPASMVREVAASAGLTVTEHEASMASEDFAFMLKEVSGCYFWLGSSEGESRPPLHSPHFDFNDALLPMGIRLWVALVKRRLGT